MFVEINKFTLENAAVFFTLFLYFLFFYENTNETGTPILYQRST